MSAYALVSSWRKVSELPPASQVTIPLPSQLRNEGSPAYALRSASGSELREKGSLYDMREFSDATTLVGYIFLHLGTRELPIPPFAELEAFAAANPDLPIVVDDKRKDPCEYLHVVLACFVEDFDQNGNGRIGLDRNGIALLIPLHQEQNNKQKSEEQDGTAAHARKRWQETLHGVEMQS